MSSTLSLIVLALSVTTIINGTELGRSKRQADISCDEDTETQIITTFLYTYNKTCPQLIEGITDWYNENYRRECATWLKLDNVPTQVPNTHVFECHEFSNGTTKYRTKICCDGKPNKPSDDQLICFTCDKDPVLYDQELKYFHTQHCNHYETGPQICAAGDVCAVELNFNTSHRRGIVTKSCMPASVCAGLEDSNSDTCRMGHSPYCAYCYEKMYGNYRHSFPRPYVTTGPCDPNRCQRGGTCETNGTQHGDPFICHCRPGFSGNLCQIDECDSQPCNNGGVCRVIYAPPYYTCGCHIQWTGYNCSESALLCSQNWCENGGTCYVQEGPDERCLCPDGFVGKRCEYSRPLDCGKDSAQRTIYTNYYSHSDTYDCTYVNDAVSQRYIRSYKSTCYHTLRSRYGLSRPLYRHGVYGALAPHQNIAAYSCEQGRDATWAKWQICCDACDSNPCQNGGWCIPNGESFTCRCRFNYGGDLCDKKLSSCYASGDPHYYTFDGAGMHYQGDCKYVMTENLAAETLPYFRVSVKNEQRDPLKWPDYVRFPRYADVEIDGFSVRLAFKEGAQVNGDSVPNRLLPYTERDQNGTEVFTIMMNGLKLQFTTPFGLEVQLSMFDEWTIIIRVPEEAAERVDGLCRDFNGSASDDYVLPNGQDVTDDSDRDATIGDYFYLPDPETPNCEQDTITPPVCDDATKTAIRSNANYCAHIENTNGPFANCIRSAPDKMVGTFMENCIYDVCAVWDVSEEARRKAACGSLAAFADVCTSSTAAPASTDWRITTRCVPVCPGDLVYKPLTTACRITCANPDPAQCNEPDTENCVCASDTDVVLPNNTCVHASVCGCVDQGREIGEVWCSSNSTQKHECVTCASCARPVGEVKNSTVTDPATECSDPKDSCQNVECEHGGKCVPNGGSGSPSGHKCECCPKWSGDLCDQPRRYNCGDKNPCTIPGAKTNHSLCPGTYHFAHEDPGKFVQCSEWGQCFPMPCPGGQLYNVETGGCMLP